MDKNAIGIMIFSAAVLGCQAAIDGKSSAPAMSKDFMDLLAQVEGTTFTPNEKHLFRVKLMETFIENYQMHEERVEREKQQNVVQTS